MHRWKGLPIFLLHMYIIFPKKLKAFLMFLTGVYKLFRWKLVKSASQLPIFVSSSFTRTNILRTFINVFFIFPTTSAIAFLIVNIGSFIIWNISRKAILICSCQKFNWNIFYGGGGRGYNTSPHDKLAVSTPIFSIIFEAGPDNVIKNV